MDTLPLTGTTSQVKIEVADPPSIINGYFPAEPFQLLQTISNFHYPQAEVTYVPDSSTSSQPGHYYSTPQGFFEWPHGAPKYDPNDSAQVQVPEYSPVRRPSNSSPEYQHKSGSDSGNFVADRQVQRDRRQDTEMLLVEPAATVRQRRLDESVHQAELEASRRRRRKPEVRLAEAEARRRKRQDPMVRQAQLEAQRARRRDPVVRQKEAERTRQRRQDPVKRELEAEKRRLWRQNPDVRQREAEKRRLRRLDPQVRQMEAERRRLRRSLDPVAKQKENEARRKQRVNRALQEMMQRQAQERLQHSQTSQDASSGVDESWDGNFRLAQESLERLHHSQASQDAFSEVDDSRDADFSNCETQLIGRACEAQIMESFNPGLGQTEISSCNLVQSGQTSVNSMYPFLIGRQSAALQY